MTEVIIGAIAGSNALTAIITGIFTTINNKKNSNKELKEEVASLKSELAELKETIKEITEELNKQLKRQEVDNVRTQLLLLLSDYPTNVAEIMKAAEHYFLDLKGDWYMTSLFFNWLQRNEIAEPEWFNNEM